MKNRIRVERAEVRMTQQQLADAIDVVLAPGGGQAISFLPL